ncbi:hypothetical protein [Shewanella sp.]|uniref:hypothetical protein n=1 Tax=Shewanella sp. TaxID=50422 RepID=UPI0040542E28
MRSFPLKSATWPLFITAPLLGLSQSILIVYTPMFIELTTLSLSELAIIMTLGSALFLISTPFWGKQALSQGVKPVLYQGVYGFSLSFALILGLLWLSQSMELTPVWLIGLMVMARVIYGLTASAIVPTCQAWIASAEMPTKAQVETNTHSTIINRTVINSASTSSTTINGASKASMKGLARLSAAMAAGRLIGPSLALGLIWIDGLAPMVFLTALPLLCCLAIWRYLPSLQASINSNAATNALKPAATTMDQVAAPAKASLQTTDKLLLLVMALMCASYSVFCYLLTPMSLQWLGLNTRDASEFISILMSLSAASMLCTHGLLSRFYTEKHLGVMLFVSLLMLASITLTAQNITWGLYLAIPVISIAFASTQLRVLSRLCAKLSPQDKVIATSALSQYQTWGYILGAGILSLTQSDILISLGVIALMVMGKILLLCVTFFRERPMTVST